MDFRTHKYLVFTLMLAFFLSACSKQTDKVAIGSAVIDMSNIEADRKAFRQASDRWHASKRSASDPVTVENAKIITAIAEKNFRKPLNLLGSHYATMALKSPIDSDEQKMNYFWSRGVFVRAAMLGDHYSMRTASVSYGIAGEINEFESAVWAYVSLEFGTGEDTYLGEMVSSAIRRLKPDQKDLARRRADSLIIEIRKNKAAYDQLIGTDF
jgi:hypothetical protein